MMELQLSRHRKGAKLVFGTITAPGFDCFTEESMPERVPEGHYQAGIYHGQVVLQNAHRRYWIAPSATQAGIVVVGYQVAGDELLGSCGAYLDLLLMVREAEKRLEPVNVTVTEEEL